MVGRIIIGGLSALAITIIASLMLIILGVIYFGLTLWIISISSKFFFGAVPGADFAVLSAALLATGAIIAGALEKK
ncbi:MAG: hypothetical protein N3F05_01535 [Candidatus Diapherotrites archaeon]|nr:hypothetical protein [Candidatus Diapherotrites archaeon]